LSNSAGSPSNSNAIDFDETFDGAEFSTRWYRILDALGETIWDILYSGQAPDIVSSCDEAFEQAHVKFMEWVNEISTRGMRGHDPRANMLSDATKAEIDGRALEDVAQDSPLSVAELGQLLRGQLLPLSCRGRLAEFSQEVLKAHNQLRSERVLSLFEEIRAKGFSQAQLIRMQSLLTSQLTDDEPVDQDTTAVLEGIRALNQKFNH